MKMSVVGIYNKGQNSENGHCVIGLTLHDELKNNAENLTLYST